MVGHEYVGKADLDDLVGSVWEPVTTWWDAIPNGPGVEFRERGSVCVVCEPGDMTHYELILTDVLGSGFRGRPKLAVSFSSPTSQLGRYRPMMTGIRAQWGEEDFYACDQAGIPREHVVAKALLSALVRAAMRCVDSRGEHPELLVDVLARCDLLTDSVHGGVHRCSEFAEHADDHLCDCGFGWRS